MKRANGRAALVVAAICLAASWAAPAAAEPRYWITELGSRGGPYSQALRLNSAGEVAGYYTYPQDANGGYVTRAFLFSNGAAVELGDAGGSNLLDLNERGQVLGTGPSFWLYDHGAYSDLGAAGMVTVYDLNDLGDVAGAILDPAGPNGEKSAALWRGGAVQDVGAALKALGSIHSEAQFVNNRGEAVGLFWDAAWVQHVFLWSNGVASELSQLNDLIWTEDGVHTAINDAGVVAGFFTDLAGERHLATLSNGVLTDLGTGLTGGPLWNYVRGINARGDLFGNAESAGFLQHAFLYSAADRRFDDVGSLGGYTCLHGMNSRGDVVGHSRLAGDGDWVIGATGEAFPAGPQIVWTGGTLYDLNTLLPPGSPWSLSDYRGLINDNGQIAVQGGTGDGLQKAVLLTPLPVTTATLTGTKRADGWYTSNVSVRLAATDAVTGVASVRYAVDGGATTTVTGAEATFSLSQQGTHLVTFYAADRKGHLESPRTLLVSIDKGSVVVTTRALPLATAGTAYSQSLAAKGGTAPYTLRLVAGTLPPGLALSTAGVLSGTPTTKGSFTFQVQVTDAKKATSKAYLTLEVRDPLVITLPASVSPTDPNGRLGLTATGGAPPYRWSADPVTPLPASMGIDFQTLLGGTGLAQPPETIRFVVTDADGRSTSANVTLTFNPPLVVTFTGGATTVAAGQPVALNFTVTGGDGGWAWWASTFDLPPGLVWSGSYNNVTIWGSIAQPGTYTVGFTAADTSGNLSAPVLVTLTVE